MMERIVIVILVTYIITGSISTATSLKEVQKKPIIVGLLSKCNDTNVMGTEASVHINKIVELFKNFYSYIEFDVCENETFLVKILADISLDPTMYNKKNMKPLVSNIITFMPDEMLKMTVTVLSSTNISIYSLTKTLHDSWFELQKNFQPVYHTELVVEPIIARMIVQNKWRDTLIIEINSAPEINIESLRSDLSIQHCIRYIALHVSIFGDKAKLDQIFQRLKGYGQLKTVFVVGRLAGWFMNLAAKSNVDNVYWLLFANYKERKDNIVKEYIVFTNIKSGRKILQMPTYHDDTKCSDKYYSIASKQQRLTLDRECPVIIKKVHDQQFPSINHFTFFKNQNYNLVYRIFLMVRNKRYATITTFQHFNNKTRTLDSIFDIEETPSLMATKDSKCPKPDFIYHCKTIEIIRMNTTQYMGQIDYYCTQCEKAYAKDLKGGCRHCQRENTIPFLNQTECYDPYLPETIYKVNYFLSGFGMFLCIFFLVVFIRNKDTPVVRSSHVILSISQITICLIQFCLFPLVVPVKPTVWVCTLRQTLVSLLLVAFVAIVVCKAEKIITIHSKKTLMCVKDKRDLLVKQMLIFCFIMFVDGIIVVSCFPFPSYPKETLAETIDGNNYYFRHCDLGDTGIVQVVYCIILLMLAIIQAYRGRKLPDAYNEGNSIITSSATSACCFLFLSIYSGRQKEHDRDFISIIWISIAISLTILLLCLYGNKVYIILFNKSLNTKAYVVTYVKTMESVDNYLHKRTQHANGTTCTQRSTLLVTHDSVSCVATSDFEVIESNV